MARSPVGGRTIDEEVPSLSIPSDKVCFIVLKARQFDAKDVLTDPDDGSNATDDDMRAVLEDHGNDPVVRELVSAINALSFDEQVDLVTLAWLGRGDGTMTEWPSLRAEAARTYNNRTARYLLRTPLLADYLEEGLAQFGLSCAEFEVGHL